MFACTHCFLDAVDKYGRSVNPEKSTDNLRSFYKIDDKIAVKSDESDADADAEQSEDGDDDEEFDPSRGRGHGPADTSSESELSGTFFSFLLRLLVIISALPS